MNIFILGTSGSGKTPLARAIEHHRGYTYISAGDWIKKSYQPTATDRQGKIQEYTAATLDRLAKKPNSCVEYITAHHCLAKPSVIDGVRNPYDFIHLFNPQQDQAIELRYLENQLTPTPFEQEGIAVIGGYLNWLEHQKLITPDQHRVYEFEELEYCCRESLESIIQEVVEGLR